jgi:hypothetical protein
MTSLRQTWRRILRQKDPDERAEEACRANELPHMA